MVDEANLIRDDHALDNLNYSFEPVETVVNKLAPSRRILVQTDIEFQADEMFGLFRAERRAMEVAVEKNPFPVRTEREKAVEDKELPVYRAMFSLS